LKLWAISDLHLAGAEARAALARLRPHPEDWLVVAGDVGETVAHHRFAWETLAGRFARLVWVPGNHDLWTVSTDPEGLRGEAKYRRLVALCREFGVLTPEDPYPLWPGEPRCRIAPLFLLYDYSFRPDDVPLAGAVDWAAETRVICADEVLLHPDPHPSRQAWCEARCREAEARLAAAAADAPLVLVNHFPLREDLLTLRRIPRFSIWCGTRRTADWHLRFRATAVVYGHLHVRASHLRDGVRFEEVSLGYARDWSPERGIEPYLRRLLPPP
jgi:3',5'-cyclic AMP phosphodiesterase CpdA